MHVSVSRSCPICNTSSEHAQLFLAANVDTTRINHFSYASRKPPEYMNHHLVRCLNCDLVFADEPPGQDVLSNAYHNADYDSSEEADDAAESYMSALRPVISHLMSRSSALEIGTGTGVLLDMLLSAGFTKVVGIEPSTSAIAAAPTHRQAWIKQGVFEDQELKPESFDLVCCFMTLEHVVDPKLIANAVLRLLRPGGAFAIVTHDYKGLVNRILGKSSPIVDIEHMQLFSKSSIMALLRQSGFERVSVCSLKNRYAIRYWWRLMPLPLAIKSNVASVISRIGVDQAKVSINVGNIFSSGFKPL
jgi:2-polyprenyl-3-methyl-5-hydroxy-6-metoxy-1,4-benzoquinol methylase